jgi:hypothetical protein
MRRKHSNHQADLEISNSFFCLTNDHALAEGLEKISKETAKRLLLQKEQR